MPPAACFRCVHSNYVVLCDIGILGVWLGYIGAVFARDLAPLASLLWTASVALRRWLRSSADDQVGSLGTILYHLVTGSQNLLRTFFFPLWRGFMLLQVDFVQIKCEILETFKILNRSAQSQSSQNVFRGKRFPLPAPKNNSWLLVF